MIPRHILSSPLAVIVAEKNPFLRASLAALLSHDGYRVFQAENLSATVSYINRINDLAVLLADLDMPGWKSILQHALDTAPDAFVIAMTGVEPIPEISDLKQTGVWACLQKPLVYNDVRQAISETGRRDARFFGSRPSCVTDNLTNMSQSPIFPG